MRRMQCGECNVANAMWRMQCGVSRLMCFGGLGGVWAEGRYRGPVAATRIAARGVGLPISSSGWPVAWRGVVVTFRS